MCETEQRLGMLLGTWGTFSVPLPLGGHLVS